MTKNEVIKMVMAKKNIEVEEAIDRAVNTIIYNDIRISEWKDVIRKEWYTLEDDISCGTFVKRVYQKILLYELC